MGSKNISIRDEAYNLLKSLQLANESFSDTIIRVMSSFGNLQEVVGKGTKSQQEYEEEIQAIRKRRDTFTRENTP